MKFNKSNENLNSFRFIHIYILKLKININLMEQQLQPRDFNIYSIILPTYNEKLNLPLVIKLIIN